MLIIKSAQYSLFNNVDRSRETDRARGVEESAIGRYHSGGYEVWGRTLKGQSFRATDDEYPSEEAAKKAALLNLADLKADGFTSLWVSQAKSEGDYFEGIWDSEDEEDPSTRIARRRFNSGDSVRFLTSPRKGKNKTVLMPDFQRGKVTNYDRLTNRYKVDTGSEIHDIHPRNLILDSNSGSVNAMPIPDVNSVGA